LLNREAVQGWVGDEWSREASGQGAIGVEVDSTPGQGATRVEVDSMPVQGATRVEEDSVLVQGAGSHQDRKQGAAGLEYKSLLG
jgi:hypothetical protein